MLSFYILLHDFNSNKEEQHDIMPYLIETYNECNNKNYWWMNENTKMAPESKSDFIHFVERVCMSKYWARCEYEWLMIGWPPGKMDTLEDCKKILNSSLKIDAWEQIKMNLDIVTTILMVNLKKL